MSNSEEKESSSNGSDHKDNGKVDAENAEVTEGANTEIPMLELDWTLKGLRQDPTKGIEEALAENIALMEEQTRRLIEHGTVEDIMRALENNFKQMEAIQVHIESIAKEMQSGI